MRVFESYADYYDILYSDKDYEGECDFLESIFHSYSKDTIRSVLDLGCGTGTLDYLEKAKSGLGKKRSQHNCTMCFGVYMLKG